VDDGSTDDTPNILDRAKEDPRVRVLSRGRMGRAQALNVGWRHAQSGLIGILDADDYAAPERLEKQVEFLQQHPEVGVVGTACRARYEESGAEQIIRKPIADIQLRRGLVHSTPLVHSSVLMRRSLLIAVGGYDESIPVLIDSDLWVRLAAHCQLANLPGVLTVKRYSRSAYFRHKISRWQKCKAKVRVRWRAWRTYSRRPADLRHVLLEPPARWLYGELMDRR
jgi:glycosyltransferase involved in cell wall biosynthesis